MIKSIIILHYIEVFIACCSKKEGGNCVKWLKEIYPQESLKHILQASNTNLDGTIALPWVKDQVLLTDVNGSAIGFIFSNNMGGLTVTDQYMSVQGLSAESPLEGKLMLNPTYNQQGFSIPHSNEGEILYNNDFEIESLSFKTSQDGATYFNNKMEFLGISDVLGNRVAFDMFENSWTLPELPKLNASDFLNKSRPCVRHKSVYSRQLHIKNGASIKPLGLEDAAFKFLSKRINSHNCTGHRDNLGTVGSRPPTSPAAPYPPHACLPPHSGHMSGNTYNTPCCSSQTAPAITPLTSPGPRKPERQSTHPNTTEMNCTDTAPAARPSAFSSGSGYGGYSC